MAGYWRRVDFTPDDHDRIAVYASGRTWPVAGVVTEERVNRVQDDAGRWQDAPTGETRRRIALRGQGGLIVPVHVRTLVHVTDRPAHAPRPASELSP